MNLFRLAIKNIFHSPLNLILSVILFGLGIGLINFLILFNSQLTSKFDKNLADIDLVIGAKGSPLQMILSSMYHIDNPTGNITVDEAKAFLNPRHPLIKASVPLSLGDSYKSYRIVGATDSIFSFYGAELESGKIHNRDFEVTIGKAIADNTDLQLGDRFTSSHGFNDDADLAHDHKDFIVTGILKGTGSVIDQLIITNPSTVWNVHDHTDHEEEPESSENEENHDHDAHNHDDDHAHHDHEHDHEGHDHASHDDHDHSSHEKHVHDPTIPYARTNLDLLKYPEKDITSILIKFKSRSNFQALSMPRSINENTDLQAASPAIEINRLYSMIGSGRQIIQGLAVLISIISTISIFIILFKSMRERRYELSLMRVMGGSRTTLFSLITLEGVILAIIGFIFGFLLSHLALEVFASNLQSNYRYSFTGWYFLKLEFWLFLISVSLGALAAIIPAFNAYSMDIHKTLNQK